MSYIEFATHEYAANYIYTNHGRQLYFAIGRLVDAADGAGEWIIDDFDGEPWKVKLSYNPDTGLKPRPDDDIPQDKPMHEYWIKARPVAENNRKKATFNISPRWNGQRSMSGDEISTPFVHDAVHVESGEVNMPDEGVNIEAQTSNVDAQIVSGLFAQFVEEIADRLSVNIRNGLCDEYHPISNITQLEGYVRYKREYQDRFVNQEGILWRLFHLVGDQLGNVAEYYADNQEIEGHLHKVKLTDGDPAQMVSDHRFRKQWKSYHPDTVRDDETDPLYHPKFGVLVHSAWQDGTMYVSELNEIEHEIEQSGNNVLDWGDLDTDPESEQWVADDHFTPTASDYDITIESDPTPALEASQDAHLLNAFVQGTDADQDMLGELAANGGKQHYNEFEYASSTVYRLKDRLPDLIESDNGLIRLRSQKLKDDLNEILNRAEREISRLAESISNVLGIDAKHLNDVEGKLERFVQKYNVDFQEHNSKILADIGATVTELKSLEDEYPRFRTLLYKLKRLVGNSPGFRDAKPMIVRYRNTAGTEKICHLDSAPAARPM